MATATANRIADFLREAEAVERQAAECAVALEAHFAGREVGPLASLCRRLTTRHVESLAILSEAGARAAAPRPWMPPEAEEFVMRLATPRRLLEVLLGIEHAALRFYDDAKSGDVVDPPIEARLASRVRESEREIQRALTELPEPPDWEKLIDLGAWPALALGAERRSRRHH